MLTIGARFNTRYENNCQVVGLPDVFGNFLALDSDGVECSFHVSMILKK